MLTRRGVMALATAIFSLGGAEAAAQGSPSSLIVEGIDENDHAAVSLTHRNGFVLVAVQDSRGVLIGARVAAGDVRWLVDSVRVMIAKGLTGPGPIAMETMERVGRGAIVISVNPANAASGVPRRDFFAYMEVEGDRSGGIMIPRSETLRLLRALDAVAREAESAPNPRR